MKRIILLLLLFSLFSCEDVVSVDTGTSQPRLVIDASINWPKGQEKSFQFIRLTTTAPYYDENVPAANGAEVTVRNSKGDTFIFFEEPNQSGYYICEDFVPEIFETYTLIINYEDEIYTASEMMYPVPDLLYTTEEPGGFTSDMVIVKAFFQDYPNEKNFYMHRFRRKDTLPQSAVFNDEFVDGNETFTARFIDGMEPGTEINIELLGISEQYYDYMMKVFATVSDANVGPFRVPPADLRGNIINSTNPGNFAFGYFRVSEVSRINHIAQ